MTSKYLWTFLLALGACAPTGQISKPPVVTPPPPITTFPTPKFEKTFGLISVGPDMALSIKYKSLSLVTDMDSKGQWTLPMARPGKKSMLKDNEDFLFLTSIEPQSYLIEFDNGRNILIVGDASQPDPLRQIVYDLRDDGKEIYLGLFTKSPEIDEAALGKTIALIQPQNALINDRASKMNQALLQETLKNELFDGAFAHLEPSQEVPF